MAALLLGGGTAAHAHPVPRSSHDRTIAVHLEPGSTPEALHVRVTYRLEVDETTVLLEDMAPFRDEIDFIKYRNRPLAFYAEYARIYAPIIADNLLAKLNGQPLAFRGGPASQRLIDEKGQPLGHLRCDFVFRTEGKLAPGKNTFWFREANFLLQDGKIAISFVNEAGLQILDREVPDPALLDKPATQFEPGDEEKLRRFKLVFLPATTLADAAPTVETPPTPLPGAETAPAAPSVFDDETSLIWLIASDHSFWLKMLLATLFGAAHALTPGHGKTLVAAYLIGERGTVWHAIALGVITTLTHTGAVLILAAIVFFLPPASQMAFAESMAHGLGLATGLLVVCLGFWLLLQRLAAKPDHVHIGGDGHTHAHSHGFGSHSHSFPPPDSNVRWGSLVLLGITGGLIPCADAVILFILFVGRGEFWLVLPALVCFSIGLAFVLVLVGVLVVRVPRFARSRFGEGRFVQALPTVSALVIIGMGFWLCYKTVAPS